MDFSREFNDRDDDDGPMDADAIGAAAAMEAFKQTGAKTGSSKAPAGGFLAGKASGDPSSKPRREEEEEEEEPATRAGGSGGMQDKLVRGVIMNWSIASLMET